MTQGNSQDVLTGSLRGFLGTPVGDWTYRGRALPYLPTVVTPQLRAVVPAGKPVAPGMAFASRSGIGLGLSIVRAIATAHGGAVHAEPRDEGGLLVRVAFPGNR